MKVTTLACIQGAWMPQCLPSRILDVGSGTGLLSLMAAQQFSCPIDAVEIDDDAYGQLTSNIASSPWSDRMSAFHEDVLLFAERQHTKYDLIITNPPFFSRHLKSPDTRINKARHEESLTLPKLVIAIDQLLSNVGCVSILLPPDQTQAAVNLFNEHSLFLSRQLDIVDQKHQKARALVSVFAREKSEVINETVVIKTGDGSYTSEYKALLKDYYLNL